jgi:hypothetical protein
MDRAFTWASSMKRTIGCVQNDFWVDGTFLANYAPICTDTNNVYKRKEERFHMTHVTLGFQRVWTYATFDAKPCTYIASRFALSPNRLSFHLSLITSNYHQVHPKQFLSWWYVWRKLCTYLALTVTLSPNRKRRDSTWLMSTRASIRRVQNNFWAFGTFDANGAPILCQD